MIRRLRVQGYKCLRDVTVDLEPLTVLIGKNDTGKSSLLDAIDRLGRLVAGDTETFKGTWALDRLAWRGPHARVAWDIQIAGSLRNAIPGEAMYHISIEHDERTASGIRIHEEKLEVPQAGVRLDWPADALRLQLVEDGRAPGEIQPSRAVAGLHQALDHGSPRLRATAQALRSSTKYSLDPGRLAQPSPLEVQSDRPGRVPRLAPDGFGLPSVLDYILGTQRDVFDTIEKELTKAVPFIRSIRLVPHRIPQTGESGKALSFQLQKGVDVAAPLASDGVLLFLAYLTLIHAPDNKAVILLEEPENGVHPRQLERIVAFLKQVTDPARGELAAQVVVATHSPYLLDFVPAKAVRVFGRRVTGETVIVPLDEIPGVNERLQGGFSLGEMWFNVGEDELLKGRLDAPVGGQ